MKRLTITKWVQDEKCPETYTIHFTNGATLYHKVINPVDQESPTHRITAGINTGDLVNDKGRLRLVKGGDILKDSKNLEAFALLFKLMPNAYFEVRKFPNPVLRTPFIEYVLHLSDKLLETLKFKFRQLEVKDFSDIQIGDMAYHDEDRGGGPLGAIIWKGSPQELLHTKYRRYIDDIEQFKKDMVDYPKWVMVDDEQCGYTLMNYNEGSCGAVVLINDKDL